MANAQTIDANINAMQCVVTKNHIGYDVIHNVCSGVVARVDWTPVDWAGAMALTILGIGGVALLFGVVVMVVQMIRDPY